MGALVSLLTAIVVAVGRTAYSRGQEAQAARLLDPVSVAALPSSSAIHARVGERWTFRRRSIYRPAATDEVWDVLRVDGDGVLCRVQPPDGGPARVETWRFDADEPRARVRAVSRETLVVSGRPIDCDLVEVWVGHRGLGEVVWLWIAMDRVTNSPTFPGVVLRDMEGDRGRGARELEVTSVGPITSP